MEKLYLVEEYFWKDSWINEEPISRKYGTLEECEDYLQKKYQDNLKYNPDLIEGGDIIELSYSTDERRNYLYKIVPIESIK